MAISLNTAIVRIRAANDRIVGTGFLVAKRQVLTCAHVVTQALDLPEDATGAPQGEVRLDFPLVAPGQGLAARVVRWQPEGDVAGLALLDDPPAGAVPVRLVRADDLWDHAFRAFGFPAGYDNGVWASGRILDQEATGWLQIEDLKQTGYFVAPGFSGGPVWDDALDGVVGMTVAADTTKGVRAGFIIPTDRLTAAWPELATWAIPPCPYRGLLAFREQDAPFFFGRETFTERLVEAVQGRALTVAVVGPSGSGKSSVVFAGLLPRLRQADADQLPGQGWAVAQFRPGGQPFEALANALLPLLEPEMTRTDRLIEVPKLAGALRGGDVALSRVAAEILESSPDAGRLLLVIDQFEELYTLCPDPATRHAFLDLLIQATAPSATLPTYQSTDLHLVLTLRADFLGQALAYRPFADLVDRAEKLILGPMNREELEAAIVRPAERQGVTFEEGLVARILDDVGSEPGSLPLLEFALTQLWERQEGNRLTHAAYEDIGELEGALTRYADQVYEGLSESEQEQARQVFVQLVRPGEGTEDTRRLAARPEMAEEQWPLVQGLADARLVVTGRDPAGQEVGEIAHEALIQRWGRLRAWMEEQREFRMWQERLRAALRQWEDSGQDAGALLRGAPLVEAREWLEEKKEALGQNARDFIQASVARARRIRWLTAGGIALAFLVVSVLGLVAWGQRNTAREAQVHAEAAQLETERQARIGRARELAAHAQAEDDPNSSLNLMLAREAALATWLTDTNVITQPFVTNEAMAALHYAVHKARQLPWRMTIPWRQGHTGSVESVAYSPYGGRIVSGGDDGTVRVWDAKTGQELTRLIGHTDLVRSVAYSPDGSRIVSGGDDRTVRVWDAQTGQELVQLTGHTWDVTSVAYSPDGSRIVSAGGGTVRVWDAETGQEQELTRSTGPGGVLSVAYSPDGARIVGGSSDGTVRVWDAETGQELTRLIGHTRLVNSVAYSPDGARIVSGSNDGTVRVWNAETGQELTRLDAGASSVAYSPDGGRIISGGDDGTVRAWDAETGQELARLTGHTGVVLSVAYSPDGSHIVSGSADQTVRIWDAETGQELTRSTGHTGLVLSVAYSPDGSHIVSGSADQTVRVWDAKTGQELTQLTGHTWDVTSVAYSPDGSRIISGAGDGTVRVWDAETGQEITRLTGHTGPVNSVAYSPDGARIVSGGGYEDETVRVWDAETGQELTQLDALVSSVAYSPDGSHIVSASADRTVRVWDAETGQELTQLTGQTKVVLSVAYSPDGSRIVGGGWDQTIRVWDAETGQELTRLTGHTGPVSSVAYSPDGARIVSGGWDQTIRVWNAETGQELARLTGHTGVVWSVAYSPDGSHIVSGGWDQTIRVWNAETEQDLTQLTGHTSAISSVAYSPDGERIVTGSDAGPVQVWDAETGQELTCLTGHNGRVNSVAYSPDGERIVTGSSDDDDTVRVWDPETGQELTRLTDHIGPVNSVAYSPVGGRIVSGSDDWTVRVWDPEIGQELTRLTGHTGAVNSVAYSPDGERIVTGSDDGPVQVWDAETGQELTRLTGHTGAVNSVAYSLDGERIVSGSDDWTVRVWDAETGQEVTRLTGHTGAVNSVAYSPDGTRIVSGSDDQTIRLWYGDIEHLLDLADSLIQRDPPIFQGDERIRFGFDEQPARAH